MRPLAFPFVIGAVVTATLAIGPSPARAADPVLPYATSALAASVADAAVVSSLPAARAELPTRQVTLSVGTGQMIRLPRPMTGLFVADDKVADVQVKSSTQLYLFAKGPGETTVYATDRAGAVVWSSNVRVGNNIASIGPMLKTAMPEADITVTPVGGMVLLTGTVLAPKDAEEAQNLAELFTGKTVTVLNRLKVATPQQVSLQVKIAEVSRSVARNIGVNILNRDSGNGFLFGIAQGDAGTIKTNVTGQVDANSGAAPLGTIFTPKALAGTTLSAAGRLLGMDLLSTLQLFENNGLVTTLAEPNLTALSGETATFLAGGEIPVPQSQGLGAVSVEFKQYGVSLAFTPTVLSGGRIALRVRPEVSQISDAGSVKLSDFTIPALSTRRAETTVELGSGQSFVIGGLLMNSHNNSTNKAPFLGDLPIIGALFRSNSFKKDETELLIVVTPYLVKPVDATRVALPTDGYRSATTIDRVLGGAFYPPTRGETRPVPSVEGAAPAGETRR